MIERNFNIFPKNPSSTSVYTYKAKEDWPICDQHKGQTIRLYGDRPGKGTLVLRGQNRNENRRYSFVKSPNCFEMFSKLQLW